MYVARYLNKSGIDTVARKLNPTPGYGRVHYSVFVTIVVAYDASVDTLPSMSSVARDVTTMFRQCGHLYRSITRVPGNPETSKVRLSHIGQGAAYSNGLAFAEVALLRFLLWLLPIFGSLRKYPIFDITFIILLFSLSRPLWTVADK